MSPYVGRRRDPRRRSVVGVRRHLRWAKYLPAIREYKVGAWKYKEELFPYVGIRKRRTVVLERSVREVAKGAIIMAITSHLGGLGMVNSDAIRLANQAYDLAFGA